MKHSLTAAALCSGASGAGMILGSGTLFGALVGLGALYCCVAMIMIVIGGRYA